MRLTVLLATDTVAVRPLLEAMLRLTGAEVIHAPCTPDLPTAVRNCRPTLVLLDLAMAPDRAEQLVRLLRADPDTGTIPLVVVSGWKSETSRYLSAGCDRVVDKPFTRQRLLEALVGALQQAETKLTNIHGPADLAVQPTPS